MWLPSFSSAVNVVVVVVWVALMDIHVMGDDWMALAKMNLGVKVPGVWMIVFCMVIGYPLNQRADRQTTHGCHSQRPDRHDLFDFREDNDLHCRRFDSDVL
jgi:uncharacterized membrane protein YbhN (UPF0104 family)